MLEGIDLSQIDVWRCVIPIAALLLGWVIGFVDSNQRTSKKIKAAESQAEASVKEAQEKAADAEARLALISAAVSEEDSLLRLKKDEAGLALELDGQKVSTSDLSVEQKKRLIELLTVMRPWLEGAPSPQNVTRAAVSDLAPPEPAPAFTTPLVAEAKPDPKKPAPPPLSIVEQINSILQLRMMNTPLARLDIRLQESHEGGVEVMVGTKKYDAVDDVPDAAIKSAIRAAIEEWEKKYTPGL
jgi:hypothetical protein